MKINAYKIKAAQKFLNLLKKELKRVKTTETVQLEMYSNGREQGYHLWFIALGGSRWSCSFSQDRHSDLLVVYLGPGHLTFSMQGNVPDEETYKKKKLYAQEKLGQAAAAVVDSLQRFLSTKEVQLEASQR